MKLKKMFTWSKKDKPDLSSKVHSDADLLRTRSIISTAPAIMDHSADVKEYRLFVDSIGSFIDKLII